MTVLSKLFIHSWQINPILLFCYKCFQNIWWQFHNKKLYPICSTKTNRSIQCFDESSEYNFRCFILLSIGLNNLIYWHKDRNRILILKYLRYMFLYDLWNSADRPETEPDAITRTASAMKIHIHDLNQNKTVLKCFVLYMQVCLTKTFELQGIQHDF